MEHDARLALVLVRPCVHVLRCVTMAIALGYCGLSGFRAQSDKSCNKSQTADPHRNRKSLCCPCRKNGTSRSPASPMSNTEPKRKCSAQRTGVMGFKAQD